MLTQKSHELRFKDVKGKEKIKSPMEGQYLEVVTALFQVPPATFLRAASYDSAPVAPYCPQRVASYQPTRVALYYLVACGGAVPRCHPLPGTLATFLRVAISHLAWYPAKQLWGS
eukprot:801821-Rhodomonas_salina.2